MAKEVIQQMELNKLNDDDLLMHLGYLHEAVKNLEEGQKTDETIAQLKAKIKDYAEERYNLPIKDFRKKLKGARYIAKMRGLKFNIDKEIDNG